MKSLCGRAARTGTSINISSSLSSVYPLIPHISPPSYLSPLSHLPPLSSAAKGTGHGQEQRWTSGGGVEAPGGQARRGGCGGPRWRRSARSRGGPGSVAAGAQVARGRVAARRRTVGAVAAAAAATQTAAGAATRGRGCGGTRQVVARARTRPVLTWRCGSGALDLFFNFLIDY